VLRQTREFQTVRRGIIMNKYLLVNTDNEEIQSDIFTLSELKVYFGTESEPEGDELFEMIGDIKALEINENIDISDENREYIIRIL
tara:strand:- start:432 stop:689 length:258 start_codon:yes stop_codon:yes gene_type:complete